VSPGLRQLGVIRIPGTSPLLPHRRRRPLPRLWCSPGRLGL